MQQLTPKGPFSTNSFQSINGARSYFPSQFPTVNSKTDDGGHLSLHIESILWVKLYEVSLVVMCAFRGKKRVSKSRYATCKGETEKVGDVASKFAGN